MKQLVVAPSFPYSTHTFVTREVASTIAASHEVTVLAPTKGDAVGTKLAQRLGLDLDDVIYCKAEGCPLWEPGRMRFTHAVRQAAMIDHFGRRLGERRKTFFTRLLRMPRIREVDMIHAHFMGWAFEVAVPLARILEVPVTLTAHNVDLPVRPIEELHYLQRYADRVILVSPEYARIWAERTGSSERLNVVPNGIDLSEFADAPRQNDRPSTLRIISVSRLVPGKCLADALHALSRLRDQGIAFQYVVIGEGDERERLQELAMQLGIADSVAFMGALPHEAVVSQLFEADILLHPSEWESFGIAIAEAMAAGLAVVAARSPGPSAIVEDGVTGFLHDPGDVSIMDFHLHQLAIDSALRTECGSRGRARVREHFSWEGHMRKMFAIWNAVLSGP